MRTGRPKQELIVTEAQREELQRLTRRQKTAQSLALRARCIFRWTSATDSALNRPANTLQTGH